MNKQLKMVRINSVQFSGRMADDAKLVKLPSGSDVLELRVAIDTGWWDKNKNEWQDSACFVTVKKWGEYAKSYAGMKKGDPLFVNGELDEETWKNKDDGKTRSKVIVKADRIQPLSKRDEIKSDATPADEEVPF